MSVRRGKSGPLKAWISEFITKKQNNRKRSSNPAIVLSHKGFNKNGNHIKEVSDGCVYIKALFTKSAVSRAEGGKCSTEDWSTGLILLRDVKLELHYESQVPEFVLIVDNFSIWDYQKGFLPKKRFEWCMNDNKVQEAALSAKYQQDMTGCVVTEMGDNAESQSMSELLEQMAEASAESDSTTNSVLTSVEASRTEKNWIKALKKTFSVLEFLIPTPTETTLNAIKEWDIDYRIPSSSSEKDGHSSSMEEFNIQRVSTLARDVHQLPESEQHQGNVNESEELDASSSQIRQEYLGQAQSQSERSGWQDCLDSVELSDESFEIGSPDAHSTQKDKETVTNSRQYTTHSVQKGRERVGNLCSFTNKTSNNFHSTKNVMTNIEGDSSLSGSGCSRDAEESSSVELVEKDNSSPIVISSGSTQSDLLLKAVPVRRTITACEQDELSRLGVLSSVSKSLITSDSEFSQSALYHQSIIHGHPTVNKLSNKHTETQVKVIQKPAGGSEDLFQESSTPEDNSCQPGDKGMRQHAAEVTSDSQGNPSKNQSLMGGTYNSAELVSPSSCDRITTPPRVPIVSSKDGKRSNTSEECLTKPACVVKEQILKTGSKHQQTNRLRSSPDSFESNEKRASLDSERSVMLRYYSLQYKSPSKSKVLSVSKSSEENSINHNGEEYSFTDKDILKSLQMDHRMSTNKHMESQSKEIMIDNILNKPSDSYTDLHNIETSNANDSRNLDTNELSEMLNKAANTEPLTLHTSFENTSNKNCLCCDKNDCNCDKEEFMNSLNLSSSCLSNEGSKEQTELLKYFPVRRGRSKYHLFDKARDRMMYMIKSPNSGERRLSHSMKNNPDNGRRMLISTKKKSLPFENTSPGFCCTNGRKTESVDSIIKPCTVNILKLDISKLMMLGVGNKPGTNNRMLPKHQPDEELSNQSLTQGAQTVIDSTQPNVEHESQEIVEHGSQEDVEHGSQEIVEYGSREVVEHGSQKIVEHGSKADDYSSKSLYNFNTQPFEPNPFQETQEFEPLISPETEHTDLNFIKDASGDSFCSRHSDENIDSEKVHFSNRQTFRRNSIEKMKAEFREKAKKVGLELNAFSTIKVRTEEVADVDKNGNIKTNKSTTTVVNEDRNDTHSEDIHAGINNVTYTIQDESCCNDSDKTNMSAEKINIAGHKVFHSKQMVKTVNQDIRKDLSMMQRKKDDKEEELDAETFSNDECGILRDRSKETIRSENKSIELPSANKIIIQTKFQDKGDTGYSHKRKCKDPLKEGFQSKRLRLDTENKEYNLVASGAEIEYLLDKVPSREFTQEIEKSCTSFRKEESEEAVLMSLFPVLKVLHRKYRIKPISKCVRHKKVDRSDCFDIQLKGIKKKQVTPDTFRSGLKNNEKYTRGGGGYGSCVNRHTGAEIQTNTNRLLVNKEMSSQVNETILDKKNKINQNKMDGQTTSKVLPGNKESASKVKRDCLNEQIRNLRDRGKLKTPDSLKLLVNESTGACRFYREKPSNSETQGTKAKSRDKRPLKKSTEEIKSLNVKPKSNKGSDKTSTQKDIPSPGKSGSTHNFKRSRHKKENASVEWQKKTSKKRTEGTLDNSVQVPTFDNLKPHGFNEVIDKESFLNNWLSESNFSSTHSQSSDDTLTS